MQWGWVCAVGAILAAGPGFVCCPIIGLVSVVLAIAGVVYGVKAKRLGNPGAVPVIVVNVILTVLTLILPIGGFLVLMVALA